MEENVFVQKIRKVDVANFLERSNIFFFDRTLELLSIRNGLCLGHRI